MIQVIVLFCFVFFWGCNGQPPAAIFLHDDPPSQPIATVANSELNETLQISKDLGVVSTSKKLDVEFEIANPSDLDWSLLEIKTTCRCVLAEPPQIIKAKGSAKFKLTIDTGLKSGDFDRQVRLNFTNRPGPVVLEVKTRMRTPLYASHPELHFPRSVPGETIKATTRIENWSETHWDSLEMTPSVDWMQVHVSPLAVPEDGQKTGLHMKQMWELSVSANPPPEVTGTITQTVNIKANRTEYTSTLRTFAERPHPIVSRPHALVVSRMPVAGESASERTIVASLQIPTTSPAKRFQILSAVGVQLDGCEIRFEQASSTEAKVHVIIPSTQSGGINGHVVVAFADGLPTLVIPVAGGV